MGRISNDPMVSIVTPSFNQARFLEATMNSVLEQTYKKIEYMVFDGGSTDGSAALLKKYEKRLTYCESQKDKGQAHAINKGWRRAKGEILAWLNSDDLLKLDAVEQAVEVFRNSSGVGIVYGDWAFTDEKGEVVERRKGRQGSFKGMLFNGQIHYIAQPASFYSAELVRQVGLLDENLQLALDYDLLLRLAKISKIKYIPIEMALFRLHSVSKTSSQAQRHWKETLTVQSKYNRLFMIKSLTKYLLFKGLNALPENLEMRFRTWRHSHHDIPRLHA